MNDFTKDELQYFLDRIDTAWKHERDLYKKVKSMIDNYCEHTLVYDEPRGRKVCSKCGLSVWTEK